MVVNCAYFLNSKFDFVFNFNHFTSIFFIKLGILSIFIPFVCESLLCALPSLNWIRKYVIKDSRLIDLTEELPVKLEFLSGQTNINDRISKLINENHKDELRILTNSYTTVEKHKDTILARCNNGGVKIIGSKPNPNSAIEAKVMKLENSGMLICQSDWDEIRVIIDGDRRLLASFATGGYQGSHIGIFSSHPFVISLFKTYFDTKCSGLKCQNKPCELHKCKTKNNG